MPWYLNTSRFYASGGGGETNTAPWTYDFNIPPSSVYGLAALNLMEAESGSGASVGFLSYVTQDPNSGVPSEHTVAGWGGNIYGLGWLAPTIDAQNVIIVTMAWNIYSDGFAAAMGSMSLFLDLE